MEKSARSNAIGIDLGTTKTTLSVWTNGHTEIILNDEEERYTPSCVCFTEEERLVGSMAQSFIGKHPWNSIPAFKRFFGAKDCDPAVKTLATTLPYKIESTPNGSLQVCVDYRGARRFSIEQVASVFFSRLKLQAESFLRAEVTYAVLSVPSTFALSHIESMKAAASISGLCVLNTISEGALAGTEYAYRDVDNMNSKIVLFVNMGGGYLDVSLCNVQAGSCFVICTSGCEAGGIDIDNALVQHCIEQFLKSTGVDLKGSYKALRKLRTHCENAKKVLSTIVETTIDIPYLANDQDFTLNLKREKLEELSSNFFEKCKKVLNGLLTNSGLAKEDIHEVVLLGGVSRMPKVKTMMKELLGKDPMVNINADEAVANGAAIHAALLTNEMYYHGSLLSEKLSFNDVLAFDIGIQLASEFTPILLANSSIPEKRSAVLQASGSKRVTVAQRKEPRVIPITSLAINPVDEIEITIEADHMGTIMIAYKYTNTSNEVVSYKSVLESDDVLKGESFEAIVAEEKKYKEEDCEFVLAKKERNQLENYCNLVKRELQEELVGKVEEGVRNCVSEYVGQVVGWYEESPLLKQADYLARKQKIEEVMKLIGNSKAKKEGLLSQIKNIIS
eukprot:TRINITY_DN1100_c0_g5_i2.p1 TRINITY_DN1100_c0_g5~~TRINITY_DN1100_c0_g5_i2.p1  ORF type:complete len:618 (+),score=119.64 TRINITY_DN1100_c0_g5_i2:373-2226(+)